jgi:hypothetical protein
MGRQRKQFKAPEPSPVTTMPISPEAGGAIVNLPPSPRNTNQIDLRRWLGQGIDEWVWACTHQLRAFLSDATVTPSTVATYGVGLKRFFEFLVSSMVHYPPEALDRRKLTQFIAWLKGIETIKSVSAKKSLYSHVKSVLVGLSRRGIIQGGSEIFPRNPFPGSNAANKGATPLTQGERARFADALRQDIIAIHQRTFSGTDGEALTVYALALALRTGLNTTPMLELARDAMSAHPFLPKMGVLTSFKRRGNATHITTLRSSEIRTEDAAVPIDGVALFKKVLELTRALADTAPSEMRNSLWLYRSQGPNTRGKLTQLDGVTLQKNIRLFVARHNLRGDTGEPLRLNNQRLRKTMESRLWRLSNGDLFTVAHLMGHSPKVADQHYLSVTAEMRANATFVGEALPAIYRGERAEAGDGPSAKVIPIRTLESTPLGRCKDSLHGEKAPKDGLTHCVDFMSCLTCRSYAIVGTKDDLHRLFSFYWFLGTERTRIRSAQWAEQYAWAMTLIAAFTQDKFDRTLVAEAKAQAKENPHLFWKSYQMLMEGQMAHGPQ